MDFLGIATWIFDLLVLQLLPLFSVLLLFIGIVKVIEYLPNTLKKYAQDQGARLKKSLK